MVSRNDDYDPIKAATQCYRKMSVAFEDHGEIVPKRGVTKKPAEALKGVTGVTAVGTPPSQRGAAMSVRLHQHAGHRWVPG